MGAFLCHRKSGTDICILTAFRDVPKGNRREIYSSYVKVYQRPIKLIFSGVTKRRIIFEEDEVNRHHAVPQDISCQVKDS